jgi:hypothetical protein
MSDDEDESSEDYGIPEHRFFGAVNRQVRTIPITPPEDEAQGQRQQSFTRNELHGDQNWASQFNSVRVYISIVQRIHDTQLLPPHSRTLNFTLIKEVLNATAMLSNKNVQDLYRGFNDSNVDATQKSTLGSAELRQLKRDVQEYVDRCICLKDFFEIEFQSSPFYGAFQEVKNYVITKTGGKNTHVKEFDVCPKTQMVWKPKEFSDTIAHFGDFRSNINEHDINKLLRRSNWYPEDQCNPLETEKGGDPQVHTRNGEDPNSRELKKKKEKVDFLIQLGLLVNERDSTKSIRDEFKNALQPSEEELAEEKQIRSFSANALQEALGAAEKAIAAIDELQKYAKKSNSTVAAQAAARAAIEAALQTQAAFLRVESAGDADKGQRIAEANEAAEALKQAAAGANSAQLAMSNLKGLSNFEIATRSLSDLVRTATNAANSVKTTLTKSLNASRPKLYESIQADKASELKVKNFILQNFMLANEIQKDNPPPDGTPADDENTFMKNNWIRETIKKLQTLEEPKDPSPSSAETSGLKKLLKLEFRKHRPRKHGHHCPLPLTLFDIALLGGLAPRTFAIINGLETNPYADGFFEKCMELLDQKIMNSQLESVQGGFDRDVDLGLVLFNLPITNFSKHTSYLPFQVPQQKRTGNPPLFGAPHASTEDAVRDEYKRERELYASTKYPGVFNLERYCLQCLERGTEIYIRIVHSMILDDLNNLRQTQKLDSDFVRAFSKVVALTLQRSEVDNPRIISNTATLKRRKVDNSYALLEAKHQLAGVCGFASDVEIDYSLV